MDYDSLFYKAYGFHDFETEKFVARFKGEIEGYLPDYRNNYPQESDEELVKYYIIPDMLENIYFELTK